MQNQLDMAKNDISAQWSYLCTNCYKLLPKKTKKDKKEENEESDESEEDNEDIECKKCHGTGYYPKEFSYFSAKKSQI